LEASTAKPAEWRSLGLQGMRGENNATFSSAIIWRGPHADPEGSGPQPIVLSLIAYKSNMAFISNYFCI